MFKKLKFFLALLVTVYHRIESGYACHSNQQKSVKCCSWNAPHHRYKKRARR